MKKGAYNEMTDDLRPEYDLSQLLRGGVRGKYTEQLRAGTNPGLSSADITDASSGEKAPRMPPGSRVRIKADPRRCGVLTGKKRERTQHIYQQVMFSEGSDFVLEAQLELISEDIE